MFSTLDKLFFTLFMQRALCSLAFSVDVNFSSCDMHNMCHAEVLSSQSYQSPLVVDPACFTRTVKANYMSL